MKIITAFLALLLTITTTAQTKAEATMLSLVNEYRAILNLKVLTFSTDIYSEAFEELHYEDTASSHSAGSVNSTFYITGVWGEFVSVSGEYEDDTTNIHNIDSVFFNEILKSEFMALMLTPNVRNGACVRKISPINYPASNSIMHFQSFRIKFILGISYN